ncbi:hypothetical protein LBMAG42_52390 [Deltaproteobacteria bacterium]|nr:hypothetical protein LBMAG42_52390 [Deltaproteobacteria bacterium]
MIVGAARPPLGWLRSPGFDLTMIMGVLGLALGLGVAASARPGWFVPVLLVDLWLLAYPHVAATWVRVGVVRGGGFAQPVWLVALFPLVLASTALLWLAGGALVLTSVYYHWQGFHYTRQSYGIARTYQRVGGSSGRDWLSDLVVFGFPVWGWLHRCAGGATNFLGQPLWLPPVPSFVASLAGAAATALLVLWLWRAPRDRSGHTLFVLSHVVITVVSYVAVSEITRGWLFVNIWHNAQYLLFVWERNAAPPSGEVGVSPRWPNRFSRAENWPAYAGLVLALGVGAYLLLNGFAAHFSAAVLGGALVLHQSVNFHHYLVDSVIWRSPNVRAGR